MSWYFELGVLEILWYYQGRIICLEISWFRVLIALYLVVYIFIFTFALPCGKDFHQTFVQSHIQRKLRDRSRLHSPSGPSNSSPHLRPFRAPPRAAALHTQPAYLLKGLTMAPPPTSSLTLPLALRALLLPSPALPSRSGRSPLALWTFPNSRVQMNLSHLCFQSTLLLLLSFVYSPYAKFCGESLWKPYSSQV